MKTVGFNISHDGAICICNNGEIEYYLEEERVSGYKHDGFPAKAFHKLFGYETTAKQLEEYGINVAERKPLIVGVVNENRDYLQTKAERMGHQIALDGE